MDKEKAGIAPARNDGETWDDYAVRVADAAGNLDMVRVWYYAVKSDGPERDAIRTAFRAVRKREEQKPEEPRPRRKFKSKVRKRSSI